MIHFQVIVCTLTIAGRLSQGKIDPKHFSHIFIDEAGSATETQTIIAVAGNFRLLFRFIFSRCFLCGHPSVDFPL